jgi:2-oxoglutarate ferredoxin oxidoreductase subunit alpha
MVTSDALRCCGQGGPNVVAPPGEAAVTDVAERTASAHGGGDAEPNGAVVIRFAGDSGDGMQLTGGRFTAISAQMGNDLATFPDFPAEIRAPAGTVHGVSSFQVQIADHDITTPGDAPSVLVAMNPAALRADLHRLVAGGTVIVNTDTFEERDLTKAGYRDNPLTDGTLDGYQVLEVPMTSLTKDAVLPLGVKPRDADRSKNLFALGLVSWMYSRPLEATEEWIDKQFAGKDLVIAANRTALRAGYNFGETTEAFARRRIAVKPAHMPPGEYTTISGNLALAWGLVAAGQLSHLPVTLGSYPITPASDILHELSKHMNFGVRTVQAEDEIAAIAVALGAAFAGHLAVTTTSGPGVALKSEALSLAISIELPLLLVDIQRGGPSTGLPTKTEAADLNIAMYGRHGEAPVPIVATRSPADCFDAAIEAARIALTYRTPVILLSDGYIANGSEPWRLPDVDALAPIPVTFAEDFNHVDEDGTPRFHPYSRDPETLARPWAIPGTPGLMHRVGGLEKADGTGNISYDPANHEKMVHLRDAKVTGIAASYGPTEVAGDPDADVCVLGWGSTWAAIDSAVQRVRRRGDQVAWIHLRHLNPLPQDLGDLLRRYRRVLVPELNLGQLCRIVRAEYLVDARPVSKVQGLPFTTQELDDVITAALEEVR